MTIESEEEIERLRKSEAEKIKASLKKGESKVEPTPVDYQNMWKK